MLEEFIGQATIQYLLKYLNPDTGNIVACYKMCYKVYKAEMLKEGFMGHTVYKFVRYLDDPTKKTNLIVRCQSETIPEFFSIKESQRLLIESQLNAILTKGEIPVFLAYRQDVETIDIHE